MSEWQRTTRADRCPICGKDSWCIFTDDAVICMRVQSEMEKVFKDGSVGWLHRLGGTIATHSRPLRPVHREPKVTINAGGLMEEFCEDTTVQHIKNLSYELGVSSESLRRLGCAWAKLYHAYAFPMWDQYGNATGIRLRSLDGHKWAVKGSKQGVFRVFDSRARRGYICEGPTDTAAVLTIGGYAIGRPHCSGGMSETGPILRAAGVVEAVILCDNDGPGMRGAKELQKHLRIRSALLILPCKDIRRFVNEGGTLADLDELVSVLAWHQNPD